MWEWNRVALPATRAQNGAAGRPSEDHRPVGAGAKRGRRMCVGYEEKKGVKARSSPGAVDTPTDCLEQKEKKKVESIEQNAESREQRSG